MLKLLKNYVCIVSEMERKTVFHLKFEKRNFDAWVFELNFKNSVKTFEN